LGDRCRHRDLLAGSSLRHRGGHGDFCLRLIVTKDEVGKPTKANTGGIAKLGVDFGFRDDKRLALLSSALSG
jgi:hypothetical protein